MNAAGVIGVVIVNYNAGDWLPRCVRAVAHSSLPVEIVVVDNASTDDSIRQLCASLPVSVPVEIIRNTSNVGYAAACNQGASQTDAPLLVFLNPDCVVEPETLPALRQALDSHQRAGLAGGMILNADGSEQRAVRRRLPTAGRAISTLSGLERLGMGGISTAGAAVPDTLTEVDAVSGALLCVRREAFEQTGGFDAGYFLHCEDLDLFLRLQQKGWKVLLVPGARATHGMGVSSASAPLLTWWHKHLGMQRFYRRHLAGGQSLPARWIITAGIWVRWVCGLPLMAVRSVLGK